ncbi:hypothetical protein RQP46_007796 [Phenoliferia psychrophenolica]
MATSTLTSGAGLTITDLLSLPRPQSGTPNPSGTLELWASTSFDFATNRTTKSISLIDLPSSTSGSPSPSASTTLSEPRKVLTNLAQVDYAWLDDRTFLYLRPAPKLEAIKGVREDDHPEGVDDLAQKERIKSLTGDGIEVWAKDVLDGDEYLVGALPTAIANLKVAPNHEPRLKSKTPAVILAFSAEVFPDGDPYKVAENERKAKADARGSDARVYDSVFVRHWDTWKGTSGQLTQVHFVKLTKNPGAALSEDGFELVEAPLDERRWCFVHELDAGFAGGKKIKISSPLAGTTLECPVGAFGGAGDFSLSGTHLLFHAKDPNVNQAWHTRTQVYLVPFFPRTAADAAPKALTVGTQGACSSPTFSDDGTRIAWLEMREDGYEADRSRLMIYEVESAHRWGATEKWDRSPGGVTWCPCGEKVFLLTEESGRTKVFQLPIPISPPTSYVSPKPLSLTHKHNITSFTPLSPTLLLLTSNSLTSPNTLSLLSLPSSPSPGPPETTLVPLATLTAHLGAAKSLSKGEDFWFPGTAGQEVHGFILFPPGAEDKELRKGKKFPMAFLVHGGPQSAWTDSWSTRWNPNIYASHGYITVTINPTGSTGYGQEFCDAIKNNWGGSPFKDLLAGLHFVQDAFPEIDSNRMAMLGASYGGYMANWIQGHNDQMGFKAIVCHDGVFSTSGTWFGTEELYFPEREFGGTPWQVPDNYSRWDPQNHIAKWRTPQLVIHGGRDYRLNESEGLGVFNTGVRWHEEVLKWIDEWTGEDAAQAIKPDQARTGYNVSYVSPAPKA